MQLPLLLVTLCVPLGKSSVVFKRANPGYEMRLSEPVGVNLETLHFTTSPTEVYAISQVDGGPIVNLRLVDNDLEIDTQNAFVMIMREGLLHYPQDLCSGNGDDNNPHEIPSSSSSPVMENTMHQDQMSYENLIVKLTNNIDLGNNSNSSSGTSTDEGQASPRLVSSSSNNNLPPTSELIPFGELQNLNHYSMVLNHLSQAYANPLASNTGENPTFNVRTEWTGTRIGNESKSYPKEYHNHEDNWDKVDGNIHQDNPNDRLENLDYNNQHSEDDDSNTFLRNQERKEKPFTFKQFEMPKTFLEDPNFDKGVVENSGPHHLESFLKERNQDEESEKDKIESATSPLSKKSSPRRPVEQVELPPKNKGQELYTERKEKEMNVTKDETLNVPFEEPSSDDNNNEFGGLEMTLISSDNYVEEYYGQVSYDQRDEEGNDQKGNNEYDNNDREDSLYEDYFDEESLFERVEESLYFEDSIGNSGVGFTMGPSGLLGNHNTILELNEPRNELDRITKTLLPFTSVSNVKVPLKESDLIIVIMPTQPDVRIHLNSLLTSLLNAESDEPVKAALSPLEAGPIHAFGSFLRPYGHLKMLSQATTTTTTTSTSTTANSMKATNSQGKLTFQGIVTWNNYGDKLLKHTPKKLSGKLKPGIRASIKLTGPRTVRVKHKGGALAIIIRNGKIINIGALPYHINRPIHLKPGTYPRYEASNLELDRNDVILLLIPTKPVESSEAHTLMTWSGIFMAFDELLFVEYAKMAFENCGKDIIAITALVQ